MHRTLEFLLHNGYILLLGWVFVEQLGLPLPSMPLLLAAGALAGTGHLSFFASLLYAMLAAVGADSIWYQLGRVKGIKILQLLCKISLEPDSCVRRTEGLFSKQGARSLLLAKFLPGLGTVAPPLAGIFHMRPRRFLFFDAMGSFLLPSSRPISRLSLSPASAFCVSCASRASPWTNSNKNSTPAKNWSLSTCATRWISKPILKPFPARSAWTPRSWKRRTTVCPATAK